MNAQQLPPKQIKAVILDSTKANIIINDLVSGDVAKAKVKILEKRIQTRDTLLKKLRNQTKLKDQTILLRDSNLIKKDSIIGLTEKKLKKETNKKNFWKWLFYGALGVLTYTAVK